MRSTTPSSTPPTPPVAPVIVVLGSTGTGKSDLAIELAARFRGEIINADAMQIYRGLPVLTNQLSPDARRGIPHHLLGHIEPDAPPWMVSDFKREALRVVSEIRARGRLPVVVGGSTYYILGLLAEDALVAADEDIGLGAGGTVASDEDLLVLEEPTERLMVRLREVDPVMAQKWHPNDRRKIQRSLEIYLRTGRRASDIYAKQQSRKTASPPSVNSRSGSLSLNDALLFWVYSDFNVLVDRLDKRVDKMLEQGMMDEIKQMWNLQRREELAGKKTDLTKGIWQSIGFKQFAPYLAALHASEPDHSEKVKRLKEEGLQTMKTVTRQYAKYQLRYIRRNFLPHLPQVGSSHYPNLFLLDSTDPAAWSESVSGPASHIVSLFLSGKPSPDPASVSEVARNVLNDALQIRSARAAERPYQRVCDTCQVTTTTESAWEIHVNGRRHKNNCRYARRRALVVVESMTSEIGEI